MRKLRVENFLKKSFLLLMLFLLNSCLTINSSMKLNSNGSGTLTLTYIIDTGLKGIGSLDDNSDLVPLNLNEDYIQQMIGGRDDIEYYGYKVTNDKKNTTVEVSFRFDSIDAVNKVLPEENKIILTREGNSTIFQQNLMKEQNQEIGGDSLEILKDIYKDHSFTMEVRVPGEISEVENGKKIDKRVALYHASFIDVITDNTKRTWSIRW